MWPDLRKRKGTLIFGHTTVTIWFQRFSPAARLRRCDQAVSSGTQNANPARQLQRIGIVL